VGDSPLKKKLKWEKQVPPEIGTIERDPREKNTRKIGSIQNPIREKREETGNVRKSRKEKLGKTILVAPTSFGGELLRKELFYVWEQKERLVGGRAKRNRVGGCPRTRLSSLNRREC